MLLMKWYVYMLRCADNSLYTGATTDVARRFKEHTGGKLGAKYTRSNKPESITYTATFKTRSEAQIEEARIKKLSKAEKESLINL
jgi:putative endonuclease